MRKKPVEVAERLVHRDYPDCLLAVLGGSASRGEHTEFSDLDIVIVDDQVTDSYERNTVEFENWIVELFFLNSMGFREIFDAGVEVSNPTLQKILAEGIILRSTPEGLEVREEARQDLEYGPMPWSSFDIERQRYIITEYMMDLKGASAYMDVWFTANRLSTILCEFVLRSNNRWIGEGKTLYRLLALFDGQKAAELEEALERLYRHNQKDRLLSLAARWIEPFGGPFLTGYVE